MSVGPRPQIFPFLRRRPEGGDLWKALEKNYNNLNDFPAIAPQKIMKKSVSEVLPHPLNDAAKSHHFSDQFLFQLSLEYQSCLQLAPVSPDVDILT